MDRPRPVEIAPDTWWVGRRLTNDEFQCHAYLLVNGSDSVLLDPGSPLTIDTTMDLVSQVIDLQDIKYLVCHHPDPDIAASLPILSRVLDRDDVLVVTEWRARALLKHYGHRFEYWLVEDHDWRMPLSDGRDLEFQLTPYLHFPGAFMSYDTGTRVLFSSDLFGGFVPDSDILVSHDLDYILESARPFHQHYMPSTALLQAGLERVRHRWPDIEVIAPQHGHVIPKTLVAGAFAGLQRIECGVFALSDADHDLRRLLRLAEARAQLTEALLNVADPGALVASLDAVLRHTHQASGCALYIDGPAEGWERWRDGARALVDAPPSDAHAVVELLGSPVALLSIGMTTAGEPAADVLRMVQDMAEAIRPAVDQYVTHLRDEHRISTLRLASLTDPLTGLRNRRALDSELPTGDYALLSLDLDHFKLVNDEFGHASGDRVLAATAVALQSSIRNYDAAYRLGGEEFLVTLPGQSAADAMLVAERIRSTVASRDFSGLAPGGRVTVSIGISEARAGEADVFDDVLARADSALYTAKRRGRDRIEVDGQPAPSERAPVDR
jgi:two-component system, cell cycle response regulator